MKDHTIVRSSPRLLVPGAVALVMLGCRTAPERSAMGQVPANPPAGSLTLEHNGAHGITVRRVWPEQDANLSVSAISPDGRYLSMIDWATANAVVRDLQTGELHPFTNVHLQEGEPYAQALRSIFSPDGRKLVVAWQQNADLQLRVLDFDPDAAGVPRVAEGSVILHNPELYPYSVFDWSPDGSQVLAHVYLLRAGGNQLALVSPTDGTYRALKTFDWREPLLAEFSPDGRFVAYDFLPEIDSPDRDLFVFSVDGTYEARIAADPAFDRLLGWHPDGSILFESQRGGTPGVWRLPMADGRAAGAAELVKADMYGIEPLGFVGDRFYYTVAVDSRRLYTANVDLASGRLTSVPVAIDNPPRMRIAGWEWSPDGRLLAYSAKVQGTQGSLIGIRSAGGDQVQTIRVALGATSPIRWAPDLRSLVVFAVDAKQRRGFQRIDLETGSSSTILRTDGLDEQPWRSNFELSPDGRTLYFARARTFGQPGTLVAYNIESGTERVVLPSATELYGNVAMSPDGTRLAFVAPDDSPGGNVVSTVPVTGGRVTALAELKPELQYTWGLEWTRDGRSIIVVTSEGGGGGLERQLWIVPAEGGEARKVALTDPVGEPVFLEMTGASPLRMHPDGHQIGFRAGRERSEVWVMEGFGKARAAETTTGGSR